MTDKQHDDLETIGHDDHDLQGEGTQAEAWQEDQPPVDDFHDQVEAEPVTAEIEDVEPVAAEEAAASAGSGMKIMIGALGIGAVFIAGLLYLQFGTSAEPTPLAVPISQVMKVGQPMTPPDKSVAALPPPNAAAGPDSTTVDPGTAPKTAEADMNSIYNAGHASQGTEAVAIPTPQPSSAEEAVALPPVASDNPPVPPSLPDLAPAAPLQPPAKSAAPTPVIQPSPVATVASAPTVAAPVPVPPVMPPSAASSAPSNALTDARLNDLAAKLDRLQKAIDQSAQQTTLLANRVDAANRAPAPVAVLPGLENRLTDMEHKIAAIAVQKETAKPAPAVMPAGLEDRLTDIERKLSVMAAKRQPLPAVAAVSATTEPAQPTPPAATATAQNPAPLTQKSVKPHHVASRQVSAARTASTAKPSGNVVAHRSTTPDVAPAPAWVLRAATPDAAWIAKDTSSGDLTKVQVGDTVEGIGKVQSIAQTGDSWSIVGSKGTIK